MIIMINKMIMMIKNDNSNSINNNNNEKFTVILVHLKRHSFPHFNNFTASFFAIFCVYVFKEADRFLVFVYVYVCSRMWCIPAWKKL